jgi:predicted HD phosphohydrolase
MQDGQPEDWAKIAAGHQPHFDSVADRYLDMLKQLEGVSLGFGCDQLHHALMTATLARRANASDEEIVLALCHDMGKVVNVLNHGPIIAEMLKPYVSENAYHALYHHQDFQGEHYYDYLGMDPNLREKYKDEPWYDLAVKFVDEWDAEGFDPDFEVDSLESFEPVLRRVLVHPGHTITSQRSENEKAA